MPVDRKSPQDASFLHIVDDVSPVHIASVAIFEGPEPPFDAIVAMVQAYPYVPLAGQLRVGVAVFSYAGQVNFGITGDYDSAADIDVLGGGIEAGMGEMLAAVA